MIRWKCPKKRLHEVYLPPFKAAVQAGAASIMAAIHELNGIPMSANPKLLKDLLRRAWQFEGLLVSDWGTTADLLQHRVAAAEEEAVLLPCPRELRWTWFPGFLPSISCRS